MDVTVMQSTIDLDYATVKGFSTTYGSREPMHTNGKQPQRQLVQSVERAVMLLEAVAGGDPDGETVADLAGTCGLQRATAWRLLSTLESRGLVHSYGSTHRYQLGPAITRLASSAGTLGFQRYTQEVLDRLSEITGETANLAMERPYGLTYIAEATPPRVLTASWLGQAVPLHATSSGKALLAWLPERDVNDLLEGGLERFTDTTLTEVEELTAELREARQRGYATCRGELENSLYGVSAPVLDDRGHPFAVVSIWGPRSRVTDAHLAEFGALVHDAAQEMSHLTPRSKAEPGPIARKESL